MTHNVVMNMIAKPRSANASSPGPSAANQSGGMAGSAANGRQAGAAREDGATGRLQQDNASLSDTRETQAFFDFRARLEQAGASFPEGFEGFEGFGEIGDAAIDLSDAAPQLTMGELSENPLAQFPGIVTVSAEGQIEIDREGLADILGVDVGDIDEQMLADVLGLPAGGPPMAFGGADLVDPMSDAGLALAQMPGAQETGGAVPGDMSGIDRAALSDLGAAPLAESGEPLTRPLSEVMSAQQGGLASGSITASDLAHPDIGGFKGGALDAGNDPMSLHVSTSTLNGEGGLEDQSSLSALAMTPESDLTIAPSTLASINGDLSAQGSAQTNAASPQPGLQKGELMTGALLRPGAAPSVSQEEGALTPSDQALFAAEDGEMTLSQTLPGGKGERSGLASALGLATGATGATGASGADGTLSDLPHLITALQKGGSLLQAQQTNGTQMGAMGTMGTMGAMEAAPDAFLDVEQLVNGDIAPEGELTTSAQSKMDVRPTSVDRVMTAEVPSRTIAIAMVRSADRGRAHFQMRLDPPELGRVDVRMSVASSGTVKAQLSFEKAETLELFQRDARALERALADAGLDVDAGGLEFSLSGDGASAFQQALGDDGFFGPEDRATANEADPESDEAGLNVLDVTRQFNGLDGRLNLLI